MEELSKELLRCGEFLTDDNYMVLKYNGYRSSIYGESYLDFEATRIRVILYNNKIYYHKMIDGEIVEIKEIGNA